MQSNMGSAQCHTAGAEQLRFVACGLTQRDSMHGAILNLMVDTCSGERGKQLGKVISRKPANIATYIPKNINGSRQPRKSTALALRRYIPTCIWIRHVFLHTDMSRSVTPVACTKSG